LGKMPLPGNVSIHTFVKKFTANQVNLLDKKRDEIGSVLAIEK